MDKTVELTEEQIEIIIDTLKQRHSDLADLLKNQEDFEAETIRDMLIEQRNLNNIIRELRFYSNAQMP